MPFPKDQDLLPAFENFDLWSAGLPENRRALVENHFKFTAPEDLEEERKHFLSVALISQRTGHDAEEVSRNLDTLYIPAFSKDERGLNLSVLPKDAGEFYQQAKSKLFDEKDERDTSIEGAMAALRGEEVISSLQAWQQKNGLERMPKSTAFTKGFLHAQESISGFGVSDAVDAYQRAMQGAPKEGDEEMLRDFEALLLDLPEAKRKTVLTAAAMMAQARSEKAVKGIGARESGPMGGAGSAINTVTGFFQEVGESGARFAGKLGGIAKDEELDVMANLPALPLLTDAAKARHPLATGVAYTSTEKIDTAEKAGDFLKEWKVTNFGTASADVTRADIEESDQDAKKYRQLDDGEKKLIEAAQKRELKKNQIARELRAIAESSDPVGPISGAIGSSVAMAAANILTRGKTLPISWQLYSEANYDQLRLENPSLAPSEARAISRVSGAGEAALDALEIGILRKLPSVAAVLKSGTSAAWRNAGTRLGATFAFEQFQEGVQDLTLPFTRALFEAVGRDTGLDMTAEWERWKDSRGTVAIASIPLILLGAGIATHQDIKDAKNSLSSRDRLGEQGISEADAVPIIEAARAGKMDEAQALYRDAFKRRSPEVAAEYQAKLETQQKAVAEAVVEVTRLGLIPEYTLLPGGKVVVTDLNDGSKATFDSWRDAQPVIEQSMNEMERLNNDSILRIADDILQRGEEVTVSPRSSESLAARVRGGSMSPEEAIRAAIAANIIKGVSVDEARKIAEDVFGDSREERIKVMRDAVERSIVLGKNVTQGGESKSKLFKGANLTTLIEETSEGRLKEGLRIGRYKKNDWLRLIQQAEEATGEKFLIGSTSDAVNASPDFAPRELVEAVSRIVVADVLGRLKDGRRIGSGSITKSLEENNSLLVAWIRAFKRLLASVLQTAKRIREARKLGKLGDEYDAYIDDLLGVDQQAKHETAVADGVASEIASYSEENPGPNGETFSITEPSPGGLSDARVKAFDAFRLARREAEGALEEDRAKVRDSVEIFQENGDSFWQVFYRGRNNGLDYDPTGGFTIWFDEAKQKWISKGDDGFDSMPTEDASFAAAVDWVKDQYVEDWGNQQTDRTFGQFERGKDEAFNILETFTPPPGIESRQRKPWEGSGGLGPSGSIYGMFGPEGNDDLTWKLRIADHENTSSLHLKPDEQFTLAKHWSPESVEAVMRSAWDWLAKKAQKNQSTPQSGRNMLGSGSSKTGKGDFPSSSPSVNPESSPAAGGTFSLRKFPVPPGLAEAAQKARGESSLILAYQAAQRGSSSAMVPIRSVYEQAKKYQPALTPAQFMEQINALNDSGKILVGLSETMKAVEAAGEFRVGGAGTEMAIPQETFSVRVTPAQDAAYMAAVQAGDMEKAQRMVDEAAKAAGYDVGPVWHGSPETFASFAKDKLGSLTRAASAKMAFFFGSEKRNSMHYAAQWQEQNGMSLESLQALSLRQGEESLLRQRAKDGVAQPEVVSAIEAVDQFRQKFPGSMAKTSDLLEYLAKIDLPYRITNGTLWIYPFSTGSKVYDTVYIDRAAIIRAIFQDAALKLSQRIGEESGRRPSVRPFYLQGKTKTVSFGGSGTVGKMAKAVSAAQREGFDLLEVTDTKDPLPTNVYAVFDPSKIKSADPVTRDEAGNVIPLSQRFNPSRDEITYSLRSGDFSSRMAAAFSPFQRSPELRRLMGKLAHDRVMRLAADLIDKANVIRKTSDLEREARTREAVKADELTKSGMKEADARKEAKRQVSEWLANARKDSGSAKAQRDRLKAWLRTLDAILSAAPAEVRAKVGGYIKLAGLATDEAMLKEIENRIAKLDVELSKWLKKEYTENIKKVLKKNRSTRGKGGQMEGRTVANVTEQIDYAANFSEISKVEQDKEIAHLESIIADDKSTADQIDAAVSRLGIAELFYDFENQDAGALGTISDWLDDLVSSGRDVKKALDEDRREYLTNLKTSGITSILGVPNASQTDAENMVEKINDSILRQAIEKVKGFINSALPTTAQQFEDVFGVGSEVGSEFIPRIWDAANQATDIKRAIEASRREMLAKVFKTKSTIKQVSALAKLQQSKKSGVFILEGRKTESVTVPVEILQRLADGAISAKDAGLTVAESKAALEQWAESSARTRNATIERETFPGTLKEIEMSEMQALNYWLHWNQEAVRARMESHGWTEESIKQLRAFMSEETVEIGRWMSDTYATAGRALVDPVYRRLYHAPLPHVKNFAPTFYATGGNDSTLAIDQAQNSSGIMASFTKGRRPHNHNVRRVDAMTAFLSHFEHVSHWVSYVELLRDMKAVISSEDVQHAIIAQFGPSAASAFTKRVKSIETQGNNQAWSLHEIDGMFARLNQARAFKGLSWRISPVVKQTSAVLNPLLADVPAHAYAIGLSKLFAGKLDVSGMWKSGSIQRRIEGGFSAEARIAMQATGGGPVGAVAIQVMSKGMLPMQWTDAGWNAVGAAIAYDYYRGLAIKAGENAEMAEHTAARAVDGMLATAAQPADLVNRSLIEGSPNPFVKAAWMFQSESRKTLAIEYYAGKRLLTGKSKNKAMDVQRVVVAHAIMGAVTQLMSGLLASVFGGDDDEEREWSVEQWAAAILAGPINGLFVVGDGLNYLLRMALGVRAFRNLPGYVQLAADAGTAASHIDDLFDGDSEEMMKEINRLSGSIGLVASGFFGPAAQAADVILGNPLRDLAKALGD